MATLIRSTDPLLQPFQLKHLTLKNRIMSTAHEPNYAEDGLPTERYRLYHLEKAKGGIALTMTAGSAVVSRDSAPTFGNLTAYRDEIVAPMKRLVESCHEHGCAVMIQLTHLGRRTSWNKVDWFPVLAPSPVREAAHRSIPKEMEDWDMARIIADYVSAAQRMQAAGVDGIELECYGHLLDQFWSPATNKRSDEFGGSLDNRLRFSNLVFAAIRQAVGPQFIVGARLVADEDWDKGLSKQDGLEICRRMVASGDVDFLNVIRGHIDHDAPLSKIIPIIGMQSNPHLDFAGEVRALTKFPVFHAARIADVATARYAIAQGKLDMVGMTRAHIADPHIVAKIMRGEEAQIRPCVGATYCIERLYDGLDTLCIHNAATAREATMPHVIAKALDAKQILVIGAGPAGLEAARVCAERGHRVRVFEASAKAGGQILLATRVKRRAELIGIVDWRLSELKRLGVEIEFNHYVEADEVLLTKAQVVIVATGGVPPENVIEDGGELAVSAWEILSGNIKRGDEVLLYDEHGAHSGLAAAEALAEQGARLEYMTPERMFAPDIGGLNVAGYMKKLNAAQARITTMTKVRRLSRAGNRIKVELWSPYGEQDCGERLVDQVVVEAGTLAVDGLYFALKPHSANLGAVDYDRLRLGRPQLQAASKFALYRIGDAVASRNIHAAVYDALRLCKDI